MEERAAHLIDWLMSDASHDLDGPGLLAQFASLLRDAGIPLDLVAFHLRRLHPQFLGSALFWTPPDPVHVSHFERVPDFARLAIHNPIVQTMQARAWRLLRADDPAWGFLPHEYIGRGLRELLIAPMAHGGPGVRVSVATFGTRQGFTDADQALLHRIMPAVRNAVELRLWRVTATTLLDTYVGQDGARRILAGHIARGEVTTLEAALMFCDLQGFTELSNRVSPKRILEVLNIYFDQAIPAITAEGGEILKFIGDGVLAIFRSDGGPPQSCRAAFNAARAAQANLRNTALPDAQLRAGIALHYGHVSYGNIGSRDRLDFTVIGAGVNLTSRIEAMCGPLGHSLLMSEPFARLLPDLEATPVGSHRLKGFADPVPLFASSSLEKE
jgi:adenylate cyclase